MADARFDIDDEVWPLIRAAVAFGDRLAELPFVTDDQRRGIAETQRALRHLPDAMPGPTREYELKVVPSEWAAFERGGYDGPTPEFLSEYSWVVECGRVQDDYVLSIGGLHHPPERGEGPDDEFAGDEHETWYEVFTSASPARLQKPSHPRSPREPWWKTWARGTENPSLYLAPGVNVSVRVTLGRYSWETDSEGRSDTTDWTDWTEYDWWKGEA